MVKQTRAGAYVPHDDEQRTYRGAPAMNKAKLVLLGLVGGGLAVSGCTTHMARNDAATPTAEAAAAGGDAAPAAPTPVAAAAPVADAAAGAAPAVPPVPAATPVPTAKAHAARSPAATSADASAAPAPSGAAPAPQPDQDAAKQAAALLPLPPEEITDTMQKLAHNPRARYLSRTTQYDYYVGGRLDAKYDINNNQLIVTSDGDSAQVKCEYGKDGKMISDGKAPTKVVGECNTLIDELGGYLSR